jgi:hypothetical protein
MVSTVGLHTTCVLFALQEQHAFFHFGRESPPIHSCNPDCVPLRRAAWPLVNGWEGRPVATHSLSPQIRSPHIRIGLLPRTLPISRSRAYWKLSTVDHLWPEPGLHIATLSLASLPCVATKVIEQSRYTKGPKNQITEPADCRDHKLDFNGHDVVARQSSSVRHSVC